MEIKNEGRRSQTVHIKDITKTNDLERVSGRIIGKAGKTLRTLNNLTNCDLAIKDNEIGIIGDARDIELAIQSITSLINGSKQGNVYARLERTKKRKRIKEKDFEIELQKE